MTDKKIDAAVEARKVGITSMSVRHGVWVGLLGTLGAMPIDSITHYHSGSWIAPWNPVRWVKVRLALRRQMLLHDKEYGPGVHLLDHANHPIPALRRQRKVSV